MGILKIRGLQPVFSVVVMMGLATTGRAGMISILPTFDSTITGDPNAAAIEGQSTRRSISTIPLSQPLFLRSP
jgi:hypothetical protein